MPDTRDVDDGSFADTFLFYRDDTGKQQMVSLASVARVTVGRGAGSDVTFAWDNKVSRLHAQFERIGTDWVLVDGGLSRNGTFVNGERLVGRRRLADGDVVLVGSTLLTYRDNRCGRSVEGRGAGETQVAEGVVTLRSLSPTQLLVLEALCRPYRDQARYATPATNRQIADELFFSVEAVKTHLRALFRKFGVEELPQNQKRAKLVELAFRAGLVSEHDR
ncbi:FHA domain-containing protein [Protofrankia symbiont of Coriaria ruscifolia]|uniref:FHA domain-containing protein n=1 Tax=Protofrankia symbiont of Coriaria ruscifolia TaxID=1306542 RepID=UPI001040E8F7|nr:FHA domain-containing protein [Protofrankia symbiont of Coriaria ruscifolia]